MCFTLIPRVSTHPQQESTARPPLAAFCSLSYFCTLLEFLPAINLRGCPWGAQPEKPGQFPWSLPPSLALLSSRSQTSGSPPPQLWASCSRLQTAGEDSVLRIRPLALLPPDLGPTQGARIFHTSTRSLGNQPPFRLPIPVPEAVTHLPKPVAQANPA